MILPLFYMMLWFAHRAGSGVIPLKNGKATTDCLNATWLRFTFPVISVINGVRGKNELTRKACVPEKAEKGLTQADLSEILHVSRQTVSRWEVGAAVPTTDNLRVLSELYGVSVDYLFSDNADDSRENGEEQRHAPKEPGEKQKNEKRKCIFIFTGALLLGVVIGILVCMIAVQSRNKKQEPTVPIGEMDTIVEDNYPVGTFSIGW